MFTASTKFRFYSHLLWSKNPKVNQSNSVCCSLFISYSLYLPFDRRSEDIQWLIRVFQEEKFFCNSHNSALSIQGTSHYLWFGGTGFKSGGIGILRVHDKDLVFPTFLVLRVACKKYSRIRSFEYNPSPNINNDQSLKSLKHLFSNSMILNYMVLFF